MRGIVFARSPVAVALVAVALTCQIPGAEGEPPSQAKPVPQERETLKAAIERINAQVQQHYRVLSPTPIAVGQVRAALIATAKELAKSNDPQRIASIEILNQIAETHYLPRSVSFYCAPVIGNYSEQQQGESADGPHVTVSLNYVVEVPFRQSRKVVGLESLVEVFHVIKPPNQQKPLSPPEAAADTHD